MVSARAPSRRTKNASQSRLLQLSFHPSPVPCASQRSDARCGMMGMGWRCGQLTLGCRLGTPSSSLSDGIAPRDGLVPLSSCARWALPPPAIAGSLPSPTVELDVNGSPLSQGGRYGAVSEVLRLSISSAPGRSEVPSTKSPHKNAPSPWPSPQKKRKRGLHCRTLTSSLRASSLADFHLPAGTQLAVATVCTSHYISEDRNSIDRQTSSRLPRPKKSKPQESEGRH